jgi:hypothetical protein
MSATYDDFITAKTKRAQSHGFEPMEITAPLFAWQRHVVEWAVRQGRAALFEDCGLGKTAQQLEWAHQVKLKTSGMVLILTPLSVAKQTESEARKFGIAASVVETGSQCNGTGIYITNYDKLDHFDVIERAVMLWSNPGDLVYSPFAGIGSEGVGALTLGRRFVGSELKESYFKQACGNLRNAKAQLQLF